MGELFGARADPRRKRQNGHAGKGELENEMAVKEFERNGDGDGGVEEVGRRAFHDE
jgi:hypothetical protein